MEPVEIKLVPTTLDDKYRKEWNNSLNDFVALSIDGVVKTDAIYRVGMFAPNLTHEFFMLLKYTEAYYEDGITKDPARKKHLEGAWCIIDKFGNEKVSFNPFENPYLIKNSRLYVIANKYYDVVTGEYHGYFYKHMESDNYLLLQDSSLDGLVVQINKKTGEKTFIR